MEYSLMFFHQSDTAHEQNYRQIDLHKHQIAFKGLAQ